MRSADVSTAMPVGSLRRFVLVGGLNTAVGFGSFPALFLALGGRVGYLPILVACAVFNPCFSFVTHKYFTFAARGGAASQAGRYVLLSVGTFLVSWGFLALIAGWSRGWFVLAQIGFNVALTGVSFVVSRRFVFAASRHGAAAPLGDHRGIPQEAEQDGGEQADQPPPQRFLRDPYEEAGHQAAGLAGRPGH